MIFARRRSNTERLREELLHLLDQMDSEQRAAFYASPRVRMVLERLYRRWEEGGAGEPIDYATVSELKELIREARVALRLSSWQAHKRWRASREE